MLEVSVDQRGGPVGDGAEEGLVLEHADVQQAVTHVGQRRDAEAATVVGGIAEHGEVPFDAPFLTGDTDARFILGEVVREALHGKGRFLEGLLHRRAERGDHGGVHAHPRHEAEVPLAGEAEVDPGDRPGFQQLHGIGRIERNTELHGKHVDRARRDDGERHPCAGEPVDGLVDGAIATDGADEVEALVDAGAGQAGAVTLGLRLTLVDLVAKASQGGQDERQVALVPAAGVGIADREQAPAQLRHASACGRPSDRRSRAVYPASRARAPARSKS